MFDNSKMKEEKKMKRKMKKCIAIGLTVLMFIALTGCASKKIESIDAVVMTYVTAPLNVPSVLDKEKGYYEAAYKEMGSSLEYSKIDSGADQTAALASGDIHILNAVGGSSVLLAAANGADIAIISMYSTAPKAFAMFSNDDNINSPEDLKGLKIAGPKGTNLHELLVAYLATAGMTEKDVEYINMDIPSSIAALEGNSIDVALVGGTAAYNMEKSGVHKITDGEGLIAATILTATSRAFAEKHPEVIETFRKTQNEIVKYMSENEDEALEITASALDLDIEAVREMYTLYDFDPELTDEDLKLLATTEEFLYNSGMIESRVDVSKLPLEVK